MNSEYCSHNIELEDYYYTTFNDGSEIKKYNIAVNVR